MTILADILRRKAAEVAQRRAALPERELEARALDTPFPRRLEDVLSPPGGPVRIFEVTPEELGVWRWPAAALAGGDAEENARITRDILGGAKGAPRDAVLVNAAAALVAAGAAPDLRSGVRVAADSIDRGAAADKLERLAAVSRG
jgi:anthranilate phosphoribosyltransferase